MTLSYEDESGNTFEVERELQLEVTEAVSEGDMDIEEMEEEGKGFPTVLVLILVAVVIVAAVLVIKRKKKKQILNEEEELLYELDGPSEDERR